MYFRSRERKYIGTKVPVTQGNVVSLPNMNYDYLIDKLIVLKHYSLFVSLYSFIVVKDGRM